MFVYGLRIFSHLSPDQLKSNWLGNKGKVDCICADNVSYLLHVVAAACFIHWDHKEDDTHIHTARNGITASSSLFSRHCNVKLSFIFRPQRLTKFHDVADLLSLSCIRCPLYPSISIYVVLARCCVLDCIIGFGAEQEHLFYKALAPSVPHRKKQCQGWAASAAHDLYTPVTTSSTNPPENNFINERRRVTGLCLNV